VKVHLPPVATLNMDLHLRLVRQHLATASAA
jgi:hypothetical protein